MGEFFPFIYVGAIIGAFSIIFTVAFILMKDKKQAIGFDRNMKDAQIIKRLLVYAKPHTKSFITVLLVMLFSIAYDIIAPLIVKDIQDKIKTEFTMNEILIEVAIYASILIISLICTYIQAIVLQKIGQKIVSAIREDLFSHIQSLSHSQLNLTPVGVLVTRVTNDTNAVSVLFTNIIVNITVTTNISITSF